MKAKLFALFIILTIDSVTDEFVGGAVWTGF